MTKKIFQAFCIAVLLAYPYHNNLAIAQYYEHVKSCREVVSRIMKECKMKQEVDDKIDELSSACAERPLETEQRALKYLRNCEKRK